MSNDLELAVQHHRAGRRDQAEARYRQVLHEDPNHAGALYGLGTLALQAEQYDIAADFIRRAIAARGDWAEGFYHLGLALQGIGHFQQATVSQRRAVALNPQLFEAQYNLAVCLQISGQNTGAIAAFERAIAIKGDDPLTLLNFAIALRGAGRFDEAIAEVRKSVEINPDFAEAWLQLGILLRENDLPEEASEAFGRALHLSPGNVQACAAQAGALWASRRIDDALELQRQVVAMRPEDAQAHTSLGCLLLLNGEYRQGFAELEWRSRIKGSHWSKRKFPCPRWDGGELAGRTIVVYCDGGYGDTIQFARYLPALIDRGAKIVGECLPAICKLFEVNFPDVKWFSYPHKLPPTDFYSPLGSLPLALGMEERTNWQGPYLRALEPPANWKKTASLNVGLVWAGSQSEIEDSNRSIPLQQFSPLAEIPGVRFFSFQKGWPAKQVQQSRFAITDLRDQLTDFADTAACVAQMDLIITVDTAMAHLAGAMGKPVWNLLRFVPHWRWGMQGDRTAWYPTMRLFRQKKRGDWDDVFGHVASELKAMAGT
jgi:tetratricopeptide (TPR) repeat protein